MFKIPKFDVSKPFWMSMMDEFNEEEVLNSIVKDLHRTIDVGDDPNEVVDEILENNNCAADDLSSADIDYLKREVENYWRLKNGLY